MTFRQLRYFTVLAEELHFGRAATRLHISQPPLSASLRQLEDELGVQLLERTSKRVAMTRAGEVFYRQACRLLSQLGDTQDLVKRLAESASGLVRIGFTPTMIFRHLPDLLAEFQRRHPGIDIQLIEKNSIDQIEALSLSRLDIGFIHSLPLPSTIASHVIADEEFVCCLPIHHPLSTRSSVTLGDLVSEPLVMFNRSLAPHYYDHIVGLFHVANVEPTIRHEVSHWLTIIALIAHGVGISLVPRSLANSGFARVAFVPLAQADARHQSRCIWLADSADMRRDLLLDCVYSRFQQS